MLILGCRLKKCVELNFIHVSLPLLKWIWIRRLLLKLLLYNFQEFYFIIYDLAMTVLLIAVSYFTIIVYLWQTCFILSPYFWGSWHCVFSKQVWAESPGLTLQFGIECITPYTTVYLLFPVIFSPHCWNWLQQKCLCRQPPRIHFYLKQWAELMVQF